MKFLLGLCALVFTFGIVSAAYSMESTYPKSKDCITQAHYDAVTVCSISTPCTFEVAAYATVTKAPVTVPMYALAVRIPEIVTRSYTLWRPGWTVNYGTTKRYNTTALYSRVRGPSAVLRC